MALTLISDKNKNTRGWINLGQISKEIEVTVPEMFKDVNLLIELLPDTKFQKLQEDFMQVQVLAPEKQGGQPIRDTKLQSNQLAEHLTNYVHDCQNFFVLEAVDEATWENLSLELRHPEAKPKMAKSGFFKKVPTEFSKPVMRQFIMTHLVNFIIAVFFRKAQVMNLMEQEAFEDAVKN